MAKARCGDKPKGLPDKSWLTQSVLAAKVGVARNTITRVEIEDRRRPLLAQLERLTKALRAQPGDFL